jgi:hypothetical protein
MDYFLNLEANVKGINKSYELALEFLSIQDTDIPLDIEVDTVINEDYFLNIEYYIEKLNKDYNLPLEYFCSINKSVYLNLEAFVNTVSVTMNLEFDILDLVYYFIRKGHNILPWNYSDGTGNWDKDANKNWNKTDDLSTFDNSFKQQLDDLNITVPSSLIFSDNKQENFGYIMPGTIDNNIELKNKMLYYENLDDSYTLVMGKRKKGTETIELKTGENLVIWDGAYSKNNPKTFESEIKEQIKDQLVSAMYYNQKTGLWKLYTSDFELYYTIVVNDVEQPIPYIINIKVSEDCSFDINR